MDLGLHASGAAGVLLRGPGGYTHSPSPAPGQRVPEGSCLLLWPRGPLTLLTCGGATHNDRFHLDLSDGQQQRAVSPLGDGGHDGVSCALDQAAVGWVPRGAEGLRQRTVLRGCPPTSAAQAHAHGGHQDGGPDQRASLRNTNASGQVRGSGPAAKRDTGGCRRGAGLADPKASCGSGDTPNWLVHGEVGTAWLALSTDSLASGAGKAVQGGFQPS